MSEGDARFRGEYPPSWTCCEACDGTGLVPHVRYYVPELHGHRHTEKVCESCLGMRSVKGRIRREAGHRCERCLHPYVPHHDAEILGVEWRGGEWSKCDERCRHFGPIRDTTGVMTKIASPAGEWVGSSEHGDVEAQWRVLTVHHLDGNKANLQWWNLAALCQRCHLDIQWKVVMERVYPHEHTDWFKPHAAGYYAWVYLGQEISRDEALMRQSELLALEQTV